MREIKTHHSSLLLKLLLNDHSFSQCYWGKLSGIILSCLLLCHCHSRPHYAPVINGWETTTQHQGTHQVTIGETLYSIAWQYGLDYRVLAKRNNLTPPYALPIGKYLILGKNPTDTAISPQKPHKFIKKGNLLVDGESKVTDNWQWPAQGVVIQDYQSEGMGNKGLDIQGIKGSLIKATASGTVVYSGDGIRGYGNLIIIKHSSLYLSAYGHNESLKVHEGQYVKRGETIGTMGCNNRGKPILHFEIRRAGKPVNPHNYLLKPLAVKKR